MKKSILSYLSTFLLLAFVSGCNSKEVSFDKMLENISNSNITYRSDYSIYYYYIDGSKNIETIQRYDVVAKITEKLYDMKAYLYEDAAIASYAHLERDNEGYVSYSDISINNELVSERAIDEDGNPFLWEESVYYNLIKYLKTEDFEKIDNETYKYIGNLNDIPLSIIHTAVPLSYFDTESFTLKIKDNAIESLFFQEKESDEVYEDCMYGRTISIKFENIGTTEIKRIEPYNEVEDNNALGLALNDIKSKDNYTITSKGILEDKSEILFQETFITKNDILQIQNTNPGVYKTGCHTYNDELYIFESSDEYLLGEKAASSLKVASFIPTFNFSKDIFEFVEENKEGYRVYKPYSTMSAVLDYVDVLNQYSEAYYSPAGDIYFFVKDNKLSKIEFPVYIYLSGDSKLATNRLIFSDFGSTTIESSVWDSFVLEKPSINVSSWDDKKYEIKIEGTKEGKISLGKVFEKCLGSSNGVPYFIPESSEFEVSGEYSREDKVVYISLFSEDNVNSNTINFIRKILLENDFEETESELDEGYEEHTFSKDNIEIGVMMIDGVLDIEITLPVGNLTLQ